MDYFVVEPDKRKNRFRIVCIGSRVKLGQLSLDTIKAPPTMRTEDLALEDAMANKAELEHLMSDAMPKRRAK